MEQMEPLKFGSGQAGQWCSKDLGCSIPGEETDRLQKIVHLNWPHGVGVAQPGRWRQGSSGNQGTLGTQVGSSPSLESQSRTNP